MSLPPELRVLCRRLTSLPPEDLPRECPALVRYALRCGEPLSTPLERKVKDRGSEASMLVHKLRTHVNSLLHGKSAPGRLAAIILVKVIIDVGGSECLRASLTWVQGLLAGLQKPDSLATKELCILSLVRIYTLLHRYQTLVREIATPTLPSFAKACLQLIKPPGQRVADKVPQPTNIVPASFLEVVACAFTELIPLYATTLRPFAAEIRSRFRDCIAPIATSASETQTATPQTLCQSARRLLILLHYTAPKNGGRDEWDKAIGRIVVECHETASQVFRAVHESWEGDDYRIPSVKPEGEPAGGSDSAEGLPPWKGIAAGGERLVGLLDYLGAFFTTSTKSPVGIPMRSLLALTARISLVVPPSTSSHHRDMVQLDSTIGKEEKEELWCLLPDVHNAVLRLNLFMLRRFQGTRAGLAPLSTIDQTVRVFGAGRHIPVLRETAYTLTRELLLLCGPALAKLTVNSMGILIRDLCRDILQAAGHPEDQQQSAAKGAAENSGVAARKKEFSINAAAFLDVQPGYNSATCSSSHLCSPSHLAAAGRLLPTLLSHVPQEHLSPDLRSLIDRTAILSGSKEAMVSSCLHPYKGANGRFYPSVLPFLSRQYPRDQEVEVLLSTLQPARRTADSNRWEPEEGLGELLEAPADSVHEGSAVVEKRDGYARELTSSGWTRPASPMKVDTTPEQRSNPFAVHMEPAMARLSVPESGFRPVPWSIPVTPTAAKLCAELVAVHAEATATSPLKRKSIHLEESGHEKEQPKKSRTDVVDASVDGVADEGESDDDSNSDSSIQIDMTMDDDEDEDDEYSAGRGVPRCEQLR